MKQLVEPNTSIQGASGWCLSLAQNVWSVPHLYNYALEAWNASKQHPNEQPPDVAVPVYWTFYDTAAQRPYGHIATWIPNKGVYSSPFNTSYGAEWYPSIQAMTDRINKIKGANSVYLGWSETLSNVTLVGENMLVDANNLKYLYMGIYGQDPSVEVSPTDPEIGQDYAETTQRILDYANRNNFAYWQVKPVLDQKVADLTKENEALKKALAEAQVPVPPTSTTDQVVITKDSLWTTFVKFVNKIRGV